MATNTHCALTGKLLHSLIPWLLLNFVLTAPVRADQEPHRAASSATQHLFKVTSYIMENGLHVIKNARESSDTFTLQLIVDLGLVDFPCIAQQTPHLVEHLLFEGTQRYDAETLRKRIHDHGGRWFGFTTAEYTHYTLSVHSGYPYIAFENLHAMLSEPLFNQENFARSVRIIESELRISHSRLKQRLNNKRSVRERGIARLYPGTPLDCEERSLPGNVTLQQAIDAFQSAYNTHNMTLMVIGRFDNEQIDALIKQHFSTLRPGPRTPPLAIPERLEHYPPFTERSHYLDTEVHINLLIRGVGMGHPDSLPLSLIADYLDERLFYVIRTQHGLGYTPRAHFRGGSRYGEIRADTHTTDAWYRQTLALFEQIYQDIRHNGIPAADLERLKTKRILKFESEERDHLSVAQLYRHHRARIRESGIMPDLITELNAIDNAKIDAVIAQYFPTTPMMAVLRPPSAAENAGRFAVIVGLSTLLAWPIWRRLRRRSTQV